MEYQVPQFIEVEDKIVGPLTLKQFIYLAGAAGLCVVFFFELPLFIAIPLMLVAGGFGAALAFYKMNGKPFVQVLEAGFNYYRRAKLFLWKHEEPRAATAAVSQKAVMPAAGPQGPRLTRGKLSELAWSLDVKKVGGDPDKLES